MKNTAIASSVIAVTLTLLLVFSAPAAFAQAGGRGGGSAAVGGRGGGIAGGGARGGAITGSQGRFVGPRHQFRHGRFFPRHQFRRNFFFFGLGGSAFVPAWWWYDPSYYYWSSPAYYSSYYNYPYYDYYGDPYWSDPCLSSDPAYAQYCPQSGYPPQGDYGAPPVGYPAPEAPAYPEPGSVSPSPAPLEQPISSEGEQ